MVTVEVNTKIDNESIINLALAIAVAGAFIVLVAKLAKK